jgi:methionyl aminopeptidase
MSIIKSPEDIKKLKHSALILRSALHQLELNLKPGVTAAFLNQVVETFIYDHKAKPSFKSLYGFPHTLVTELNEVVVHGLSDEKTIIPENCIVSFDSGVCYDGLYSDMCLLFILGEVPDRVKKMKEITEKSLWAGIKQIKAGKKTGDIGFAVNKVIKDAGFGNVLDLGGHGLGYKPHDEPHITHSGKLGTGSRLFESQVIAIEPMVTLGSGAVDFIPDKETGWEVVISKEKVWSAHIEHTILVTKNGCEVLTDIPVDNLLI